MLLGPYHGVTRLVALSGGIHVSVNSEDTLSINSNRLVELEPYVYRELYSNRRMVFGKDARGKVRHLFFADVPPMSAVRMEWYESCLGWLLAASAIAVAVICGMGFSDEDKIVFGDTEIIKALLATTPVVVGW